MTPDDVENLLFWGVLALCWAAGWATVFLSACVVLDPSPSDLLGLAGRNECAWRSVGSAYRDGALCSQTWHAVLAADGFCGSARTFGTFFGRIGNFINGELWGRPASPDLPWAMIFPQAQDGGISRHPSQLYEAGLEGLALFVVIWLYSRKPRPVGRTAALFALGYGAARFVSEYFREPDAFLGLQALGLSRGQWLTLPLILAGLTLWVWAGRRRT